MKLYKLNSVSIPFFAVIILLIMTLPTCAQNKKRLDSIVKLASNQMYNNPDNVIKSGLIVLKEAGKNNDYKILGYKLISDGYSAKRDYEKSLEYIMKASQLLSFSNDQLLKIITLNKIGIQYHQLKIYDKAIEYLDQSEHIMMEYPVPDSIRTYLGRNYIVRGFIYKEKFNCEIALDFFDRGIIELQKTRTKIVNSAISIAKYNKGNCYILMLNNKLAKQNFEEANQYAKDINALSLQAFALKGLAQVYTLEGNYQLAISTLNNAFLLSSSVDDLILNQEIYKGLSENYLALNNWEEFKKYQNKFISTQKLIKDRERKSVSESLNLKDESLKLELKNEISKYYYKFIAAAFVIIFLVIAFVLFIKNKVKKIRQLRSEIQSLQNE
jgi:tetratricopeptide (TPR) repeat protein